MTDGRQARERRGRSQRGATLIEAAIILPLLFALLFGIADFANAYNDYNSVRQGVREGARQGVVGNIPATTCTLNSPGTANATTQSLMCITKERIGLTAADTYVKVRLADTGVSPPTYADTNYVADSRHGLVVCAQYPLRSLTRFYSPLLDGRWLRTTVTMNIENPVAGMAPNQGEETRPGGLDWSWCTA
jgi:Flp pilus assembly protein TadG